MKYYLQKLNVYFSQPSKLVVLNVFCVIMIILFNIKFQGFCIPSTWALIVLIVCLSVTCIHPLVKSKKGNEVLSFLSGCACVVYLYFIYFLGNYNILGLFLLPILIGAVVFVPHFFLIQLFVKYFLKSKNKLVKSLFVLGVCAPTMLIVWAGLEYKQAILNIKDFEKSNYTQLKKNYMTEKILGMHFIYHTRIEMIYDGWRPPIHEPLMVIGMRLNGDVDPLHVNDLKTRLKLYRKFYPHRTYKFECSCAIDYSKDYHQDALWKD